MNWRGVVASLTCLTAFPAAAANHAILVGVSDYRQDGIKTLEGPINDVPLIWEALRARGFEAASFQIFADRRPEHAAAMPIAGEPTKQNIIDALDDLVSEDTVKKGDTVVLYFSGHGSQQPVSPSSRQSEPDDGLDEVFLPIDVAGWSNEDSTVTNAIVDDEIARYVGSLREKEALVWVIFDSCHSGTMTRGVQFSDIELKQVSPLVLGVPVERLAAAAESVNSAVVVESDRFEIDTISRSGSGRLIATYAAQPYQLAIGKKLPPWRSNLASEQRVNSVLTFYLAQTLQRIGDATFRDLIGPILSGYDRNRIDSRPLFEGDLDEATPGSGKAYGRGFMVSRDLEVEKQFIVSAGQLAGLVEGDILKVTPVDAADDGGSIGQIELTLVGFTESRAKAMTGFDGLRWSQQPTRFYGQIGTSSLSYVLRVASPTSEGANGGSLDAARRAFSAVVRAGLIPVELVNAGASAEIHPRVEDGQILLLNGAGAWPSETLSREARAAAFANIPAIQIDPHDANRTANDLTNALRALVRQHNLTSLIAEMAENLPSGPLVVEGFFRRSRIPAGRHFNAPSDPRDCISRQPAGDLRQSDEVPRDAVRFDLAAPPAIFHCDTLFIKFANAGEKPILITPIYSHAARGCLQLLRSRRTRVGTFTLYPGESRLLDIPLIAVRKNDETHEYEPVMTGSEALLVIAVEPRARQVGNVWLVEDFDDNSLDHLDLGCVRPFEAGIDDVAIATRSYRSGRSDRSVLARLLDTAVFGDATTRAVRRSAIESSYAAIVRWIMWPHEEPVR
ncbi:caspase family protein [Sinorhizobium meliloti]|uniref:caspase family protein n=1 Tax=Rhizobium meliloti TaxID=382 RepID=UPI0030D2FA2C